MSEKPWKPGQCSFIQLMEAMKIKLPRKGSNPSAWNGLEKPERAWKSLKKPEKPGKPERA